MNSDNDKNLYTESWDESVVQPLQTAGHKGIVSSRDNAKFQELAEKYGVDRRKLQMKLDFCILPPICLLYLLAYLDRLNISNANVYGLSEQLNMSSIEYSVALAVFYVPYVVFEIPANYLLKLLSPHVLLSVMITIFGCVSLGQGFVHSYHTLLVCRVLLGFAESAMLPACYYLLGSWYTRAEGQKRYSFFFSSTSLAGAFGGLIAYGMNSLNMKRGLEGWRWLFIVEGAITAFCGILLFFMITDFPETAKFLKPNERAFIKEKLKIDQGDSNFEHRPRLGEMLRAFADIKMLLAALTYFGLIVTIYGYAYFSISIIKTFNYSAVDTQVYSIYPWLCSFGMNILVATLSDFSRIRFPYVIFCTLSAVVGLGILLGTDPIEANKHVRYAACFLISYGVYCAGPILVCWATMNLVGHTRKMVGSGFIIAFGNCGGFVSTFAYEQKDAPGYIRGLWTSMGLVLMAVASMTLYLVCCVHSNRKKERNFESCEEKWKSLTLQERSEMGDLDPNFRFMY